MTVISGRVIINPYPYPRNRNRAMDNERFPIDRGRVVSLESRSYMKIKGGNKLVPNLLRPRTTEL